MRGRQDAKTSSVLLVVAVLCLVWSYRGANIEAPCSLLFSQWLCLPHSNIKVSYNMISSIHMEEQADIDRLMAQGWMCHYLSDYQSYIHKE